MQPTIKNGLFGILFLGNLVCYAAENDLFLDVGLDTKILSSSNDSVYMAPRLGLNYGFNDNTDLNFSLFKDIHNVKNGPGGFSVGSLYTAPLGDIRPGMGLAVGVYGYKPFLEADLRAIYELSGVVRAYVGVAPQLGLVSSAQTNLNLRVGFQIRLK